MLHVFNIGPGVGADGKLQELSTLYLGGIISCVYPQLPLSCRVLKFFHV